MAATQPAFEPIRLPNGQQLKNRLVKAAMEENLGAATLAPGGEMLRLYRQWAEGGVGLIITGNVMVDKLAMTGPGGVALEDDTDLAPFHHWALEAKHNNTRVWMQISHPGRQVFKAMGGKALAPSAIALNLGKHSKMFPVPKAMDEAEILDVIQRFVNTAQQAERAGFDGVQIHAAHGYLLNQFLSPRVNQRQDPWGGSLENRARLLMAVVRGIRAKVSKDFAVAVKLNSADFQRGGFDQQDAAAVVAMLNRAGVDLIEISGGNYEAPAMQGRTADDSTLAREAYFLEFAQALTKVSEVPLMTTGGIRGLDTVERVLAAGVDLVGIASALAVQPDLPLRWQHRADFRPEIPTAKWKDKTLSGLANMAIIKRYLKRWGAGKSSYRLSPLLSLILGQLRQKKLVKRYRSLYIEPFQGSTMQPGAAETLAQ
ncbi:2,4-dienoyl-CoA reductase [Microbulbifer flavimaris]|uniref:2,4-dienoyl-CoA reductase n=1 Tax=Microbulbifer flavimaris TaxID=1781068 RepID=A0ABX4I0Y6_9GAMM|nr:MULTISPECIES: NADH:flavin oxidoreductase/NADH oxidase family protein [Microbulbifer]KUJ83805.1 2,4-dienoyl-CoA reductase [Microbulbifer sp. ZGT114]PCO05981.1 2,4-dienoyl-CoA reductase [Microbulbifer flavimaris]